METLQGTGTLGLSLESKVKPGDLAAALDSVRSIVDRKGTHKTAGVRIEWGADDVRVTATDSYCLLTVGTNDVPVILPDGVTVHHKDVVSIVKLLKVKGCHSVTFTVTDMTLIVATPDGSLNIPLLDGTYPNYRDLVAAVAEGWPSGEEPNPVFDPAILSKLMAGFDLLVPKVAARVRYRNLDNRKPTLFESVGDGPAPWTATGLVMPCRI